jgi:hypothetical protein
VAHGRDWRWSPVKEGEDLSQVNVRRVTGSITDYTALEEEWSIRACSKYVPISCKYASEAAKGQEPVRIGVSSCWNACRCLPNMI